VFKQVMPCLIANPLRGRICASQFSGMAKKSPVGTKHLSMGANVMGAIKNALKSMPDDPLVA
jgi:hypothetical protein